MTIATRPMYPRRAVVRLSTRVVAIIALTTSACSAPADAIHVATSRDGVAAEPVSIGAPQPIGRTYDAVDWQPVWTRGGDREEELLAVVKAMVPLEHGVLIADEGALTVMTLDGETGATRWSVGRKGGGPGEFQAIHDIAMDAAGRTLVLDHAAGRITTLSPDGELHPYRSNAGFRTAQQLCVLDDGRIAAIVRRPDAWLEIVRDSSVEQRFAFPAELPDGAPSMVTASSFARGASDSTCTVFTSFGYGIGSLHAARRPLAVRPFVEALPHPEFEVQRSTDGPTPTVYTTLKSGVSGGSRASVWRDTVMINFLGKRGPDKPVLDLYDRDGRYLASWRMPAGSIEEAAYANGMLYTISRSTVAPQLTAWRRTRHAAR